MVTSQTTTASSTNYQCFNRTIIPSSRNITTLNPYIHTSQLSQFSDPNPPNITCPETIDRRIIQYTPGSTKVRSVWYQWTPATSGYYDFKVTIPSSRQWTRTRQWWFSIMKGTSCSNLRTPLGCRLTSARGVYLNAKTTYFITIITITTTFGDNVELTLSPTIFRPVNDDCQNAIAIRSSVTLPFTITTNSLITNATIQPNERIPSADRLSYNFLNNSNFGGYSIWYSYIPPTTGYYNFSTLGTLSRDKYSSSFYAPITIAVYEAIGFGNNTNNTRVCSNMTNHFTEVYCSRNVYSVDRNEELKGGKQLYIQLVTDMYTNVVITNVVLTIDRAPAPPINDECSGAIVINPIAGVNKVFDATAAASDALHFPNGLRCGEVTIEPYYLFSAGVWYKYVHTGGITEIVHKLCNFYNGANQYYVLTGNDCNNLKCVGVFPISCDDPVITSTVEQPTTYWFLLTIEKYSDPIYNFANFSVSLNNFRLINAVSDTTIGYILSDAVYSYGLNNGDYPRTTDTTKLNIEAYFHPALNVQSTRITFTNPNFTRCETTKPFSVFGSTNGNYSSGLITIGTHRVTAIPYTQPGCQGAPIKGATLSKKLTMLGCSVYYFDYSALECDQFLGGYFSCSYFPFGNITIDLYNADTNTSIIGDTITSPRRPVFGGQNLGFSFVKLDAKTDTFSPINLLPSSKYVMTLTIDGLRQPSKIFAIKKACVPW